MPDGNIQPEFIDTLKEMGKWLNQNGESIYGTKGNLIPPQEWGVMTAKGKTVFAHILKRPAQSFVFIPLMTQKINKAVSFADKKNLQFKQQAEGVFIYTDGITWNDADTIVQLELQ